jgi:hypothetical protein
MNPNAAPWTPNASAVWYAPSGALLPLVDMAPEAVGSEDAAGSTTIDDDGRFANRRRKNFVAYAKRERPRWLEFIKAEGTRCHDPNRQGTEVLRRFLTWNRDTGNAQLTEGAGSAICREEAEREQHEHGGGDESLHGPSHADHEAALRFIRQPRGPGAAPAQRESGRQEAVEPSVTAGQEEAGPAHEIPGWYQRQHAEPAEMTVEEVLAVVAEAEAEAEAAAMVEAEAQARAVAAREGESRVRIARAAAAARDAQEQREDAAALARSDLSR